VYAAAAGTAWFELTPPTAGTWPLEAVLTNPATGVSATRSVGTFVVGSGAVSATCTFAAQLYTLTGASASVTATGYNANTPTCVALYASKSAADLFPTSLVSQRVALSDTGTASVLATFPSPGDWYVYARLSDTDGVGNTTVQASGGSVSVADYALPTVAAQSFALFDGVTSAFSLALEGPTTALSAKSFQIALASSPSTVAATEMKYDAGSVSFKMTPTLVVGTWPMSVVIASPLANSSFSVTRSLGSVVVGEASAFPFPTAATLVAPQTLVTSYSATVTIALSAPARTAGTAQVWYASTSSDAAPTPVGTYDVSILGTVSFPFVSAAVGSVYFYVKAESIAGTRQAAYLVAGPAATREFVLPTSFVVTSELPLFIEGADAETVPCTRMITMDAVGVTATPQDAVARATIAFSYNTTKSWSGATVSSAGTLEPDGKAAARIRLTKGGTYYLLARVTAPGGQYVDLICNTPVSTILSPLWPSSRTSTYGVGAFHMLGADYRVPATQDINNWWPAWFFTVYNKDGYLDTSVNYMGELTQYDNFAILGGGRALITLIANFKDALPTKLCGVSSASPTFSFSWRYKRPMAVRRIYLCPGAGILDNATRFTLTGYTVSGSVESSAQVVHTSTGKDINENGADWMEIASPVACEFYRFMQTEGPLVNSNQCLTMVLGN
jgi:hypothetical protein